jgi:hypothetical protein
MSIIRTFVNHSGRMAFHGSRFDLSYYVFNLHAGTWGPQLAEFRCEPGRWRLLREESGGEIVLTHEGVGVIDSLLAGHRILKTFDPGYMSFMFRDGAKKSEPALTPAGTILTPWTLYGSSLNHRNPFRNHHDNLFFLLRPSPYFKVNSTTQ